MKLRRQVKWDGDKKGDKKQGKRPVKMAAPVIQIKERNTANYEIRHTDYCQVKRGELLLAIGY